MSSAVVLSARLMLLRVAPSEPHLSLLHVGLCSREGEQTHSASRAEVMTSQRTPFG